ncbi:uncharacterized protein LOC123209683 [Mangifera indica]|uniref:uncharacterized protein LOC123209683 n=1 Tax=Mangifera indica TaxID=29780 RepID=UPI001CFB2BAA|nr:uncharacterized protein LOC123209683 [Mangifera indica]
MNPAGSEITECYFECICEPKHREKGSNMFKQQDDYQAESPVLSLKKRTQLLREITLKLPEDLMNKVKEMAANTHEKDLMLPSMEQYLWWSNGYPTFECPSYVFEPEWIDGGLISMQRLECRNPEQLKHLPGIVTYAISCLDYYAPKYLTTYISSTLLERSRDDPLKVYYPYQVWEFRPSCNVGSGFGIRLPDPCNDNAERWQNYWSAPLDSRIQRACAFVDQLRESLRKTDRAWLLFDGRRIVVLPKEWVVSIDRRRTRIKGCKMLLRQFQEEPRSLNLPPYVIDEYIKRTKIHT